MISGKPAGCLEWVVVREREDLILGVPVEGHETFVL